MSNISTDLQLASSLLREGEIIAIPTETVYGLAGNAENEIAIRKIYALKQRPLNHPLIMHVALGCDISQWVAPIPDYAHQLMARFWPGPLTLVMTCRAEKLNPLITGGQSTLALRCPQHPLAQALLQELPFPLVAPSANSFGKISPTTAAHVQQSFPGEDLFILDGGRCRVGIESTIIAASDPRGYEILRSGLIDESEINAAFPGLQIHNQAAIKVPGSLKQHYQPQKPLYYFNDFAALTGFCKQEDKPGYKLLFSAAVAKNDLGYQLPNSPAEAAFELYYQLRRADQAKVAFIAIELPPFKKSWQAIRERLFKAGRPGAVGG